MRSSTKREEQSSIALGPERASHNMSLAFLILLISSSASAYRDNINPTFGDAPSWKNDALPINPNGAASSNPGYGRPRNFIDPSPWSSSDSEPGTNTGNVWSNPIEAEPKYSNHEVWPKRTNPELTRPAPDDQSNTPPSEPTRSNRGVWPRHVTAEPIKPTQEVPPKSSFPEASQPNRAVWPRHLTAEPIKPSHNLPSKSSHPEGIQSNRGVWPKHRRPSHANPPKSPTSEAIHSSHAVRPKQTNSEPKRSPHAGPLKPSSPEATSAVLSDQQPPPENAFCASNPGRCKPVVMYSQCYRCTISQNCTITCYKNNSCSKCESPIIGAQQIEDWSKETGRPQPITSTFQTEEPNKYFTENNKNEIGTRNGLLPKERRVRMSSGPKTNYVTLSYEPANNRHKLQKAPGITINFQNCEDVYVVHGCFDNNAEYCKRRYKEEKWCQPATMFSQCYRCIVSEDCKIKCQRRYSCRKCLTPVCGSRCDTIRSELKYAKTHNKLHPYLSRNGSFTPFPLIRDLVGRLSNNINELTANDISSKAIRPTWKSYNVDNSKPLIIPDTNPVESPIETQEIKDTDNSKRNDIPAIKIEPTSIGPINPYGGIDTFQPPSAGEITPSIISASQSGQGPIPSTRSNEENSDNSLPIGKQIPEYIPVKSWPQSPGEVAGNKDIDNFKGHNIPDIKIDPISIGPILPYGGIDAIQPAYVEELKPSITSDSQSSQGSIPSTISNDENNDDSLPIEKQIPEYIPVKSSPQSPGETEANKDTDNSKGHESPIIKVEPISTGPIIPYDGIDAIKPASGEESPASITSDSQSGQGSIPSTISNDENKDNSLPIEKPIPEYIPVISSSQSPGETEANKYTDNSKGHESPIIKVEPISIGLIIPFGGIDAIQPASVEEVEPSITRDSPSDLGSIPSTISNDENNDNSLPIEKPIPEYIPVKSSPQSPGEVAGNKGIDNSKGIDIPAIKIEPISIPSIHGGIDAIKPASGEGSPASITSDSQSGQGSIPSTISNDENKDNSLPIEKPIPEYIPVISWPQSPGEKEANNDTDNSKEHESPIIKVEPISTGPIIPYDGIDAIKPAFGEESSASITSDSQSGQGSIPSTISNDENKDNSLPIEKPIPEYIPVISSPQSLGETEANKDTDNSKGHESPIIKVEPISIGPIIPYDGIDAIQPASFEELQPSITSDSPSDLGSIPSTISNDENNDNSAPIEKPIPEYIPVISSPQSPGETEANKDTDNSKGHESLIIKVEPISTGPIIPYDGLDAIKPASGEESPASITSDSQSGQGSIPSTISNDENKDNSLSIEKSIPENIPVISSPQSLGETEANKDTDNSKEHESPIIKVEPTSIGPFIPYDGIDAIKPASGEESSASITSDSQSGQGSIPSTISNDENKDNSLPIEKPIPEYIPVISSPQSLGETEANKDTDNSKGHESPIIKVEPISTGPIIPYDGIDAIKPASGEELQPPITSHSQSGQSSIPSTISSDENKDNSLPIEKPIPEYIPVKSSPQSPRETEANNDTDNSKGNDIPDIRIEPISIGPIIPYGGIDTFQPPSAGEIPSSETINSLPGAGSIPSNTSNDENNDASYEGEKEKTEVLPNRTPTASPGKEVKTKDSNESEVRDISAIKPVPKLITLTIQHGGEETSPPTSAEKASSATSDSKPGEGSSPSTYPNDEEIDNSQDEEKEKSEHVPNTTSEESPGETEGNNDSKSGESSSPSTSPNDKEKDNSHVEEKEKSEPVPNSNSEGSPAETEGNKHNDGSNGHDIPAVKPETTIISLTIKHDGKESSQPKSTENIPSSETSDSQSGSSSTPSTTSVDENNDKSSELEKEKTEDATSSTASPGETGENYNSDGSDGHDIPAVKKEPTLISLTIQHGSKETSHPTSAENTPSSATSDSKSSEGTSAPSTNNDESKDNPHDGEKEKAEDASNISPAGSPEETEENKNNDGSNGHDIPVVKPEPTIISLTIKRDGKESSQPKSTENIPSSETSDSQSGSGSTPSTTSDDENNDSSSELEKEKTEDVTSSTASPRETEENNSSGGSDGHDIPAVKKEPTLISLTIQHGGKETSQPTTAENTPSSQTSDSKSIEGPSPSATPNDESKDNTYDEEKEKHEDASNTSRAGSPRETEENKDSDDFKGHDIPAVKKEPTIIRLTIKHDGKETSQPKSTENIPSSETSDSQSVSGSSTSTIPDENKDNPHDEETENADSISTNINQPTYKGKTVSEDEVDISQSASEETEPPINSKSTLEQGSPQFISSLEDNDDDSLDIEKSKPTDISVTKSAKSSEEIETTQDVSPPSISSITEESDSEEDDSTDNILTKISQPISKGLLFKKGGIDRSHSTSKETNSPSNSKSELEQGSPQLPSTHEDKDLLDIENSKPADVSVTKLAKSSEVIKTTQDIIPVPISSITEESDSEEDDNADIIPTNVNQPISKGITFSEDEEETSQSTSEETEPSINSKSELEQGSPQVPSTHEDKDLLDIENSKPADVSVTKLAKSPEAIKTTQDIIPVPISSITEESDSEEDDNADIIPTNINQPISKGITFSEDEEETSQSSSEETEPSINSKSELEQGSPQLPSTQKDKDSRDIENSKPAEISVISSTKSPEKIQPVRNKSPSSVSSITEDSDSDEDDNTDIISTNINQPISKGITFSEDEEEASQSISEETEPSINSKSELEQGSPQLPSTQEDKDSLDIENSKPAEISVISSTKSPEKIQPVRNTSPSSVSSITEDSDSEEDDSSENILPKTNEPISKTITLNENEVDTSQSEETTPAALKSDSQSVRESTESKEENEEDC